MLSSPPENSGARALYSRARKCRTTAAKRQVTVGQVASLDLQTRVIKVEISFDASHTTVTAYFMWSKDKRLSCSSIIHRTRPAGRLPRIHERQPT